MGKWQTLYKSTGMNLCASLQHSLSEPIVELTWLPAIRHDDIILLSCWRPPSKEFLWTHLPSDMETGLQPPAELSWAALEPCWDLPGPQLSLPGASLEVKVSYNPCSWHTHANAEASTHYVGMQAHAQVKYIEEYMCATINQYRGKEITLYVQIYAHSYIMIPL